MRVCLIHVSDPLHILFVTVGFVQINVYNMNHCVKQQQFSCLSLFQLQWELIPDPWVYARVAALFYTLSSQEVVVTLGETEPRGSVVSVAVHSHHTHEANEAAAASHFLPALRFKRISRVSCSSSLHLCFPALQDFKLFNLSPDSWALCS